MNETYSMSTSTSSDSLDLPLFSGSKSLQQTLSERLGDAMQRRLARFGSMEFELNWKRHIMPSGHVLCLLRASERRTGDKGCSGWPTPMAGTAATADYNEAGNTDSGRRTVELCGWPTCSARDWKDSEGMATEGVNPDGSTRKRLDMLPRVAQLAAWPTPQTEDSGESATERKGGENLAVIAAWATPRAEDAESAGMRHSRGVADTLTAQAGQGTTSSPAETGKRGVLNPNHSRWLMGLPLSWTLCGMLAFLKIKSSRQSARSRLRATPSPA